MNEGAVLIFARRPELGQVKTRLATCIGKNSALALYQAFLMDTLLSARQSGATVLLAHTHGDHFPEQELADITYEQRGSSFGERFDAAFADAKSRLPDGTPLVLIGADTPHLPPKFLRYALDHLRDSKAVIGPSSNGGFYLLGFSTTPVPISEAFDHSSDRETIEVVRLLIQSGVKPKLLDFWFDVDLPEDLVKLVAFLDLLETISGEWVPRHTRDLLIEIRHRLPTVHNELRTQDRTRSILMES
ncbi:MAG TPA: TIGR04282 family arsenosugar biosynthesis glycosyltransferase [Candidatus Bathyarchaeia archaeon]|nr:TIGR04282 family arsenosugar biosynthesis glycosyltransferase [Candidatus Bathyarchaeia archaeon]